nr:nitroreductase family protein [Maliibacterium massiliense]
MRNEHIIQIDPAKCVGRGLYTGDCPAGNLSLQRKKAEVIAQDCIKCGHCVAICPRAAVSITGFDAPPEAIQQRTTLDPDQLLAAIKTRRSIRRYSIDQIIEAGRLTPTGGNAQDCRFIVLKEDMDRFEARAVRLFRRLRPLAKLVNPAARRIDIDVHFFFKGAPAALAIVSRSKVDGALAAAHMALMAEACGLGVLYSGFFAMAANCSRALRRMLGLARGEQVVTALVLGYANVVYHRTAQKEAACVCYV